MKNLKTWLRLSALAALLCCAVNVNAQFAFGIKVGMNVSKLHLNKEVFESSNRAGLNAGIMAEFTVPIIGVGADISAMYVRRNAEFLEGQNIETSHRDYIEIPLNLKYKLNLPAVNHIIRPFVTTGPSVAVLAGKDKLDAAWKNRNVDWAWNFGLGVELIRHLQIAASYGLGMSKAVEYASPLETTKVDGKNRYWTVTAAWLF